MSKKDLHFPKNREHEINNSLPGDSTELLNAAIKQLGLPVSLILDRSGQELSGTGLNMVKSIKPIEYGFLSDPENFLSLPVIKRRERILEFVEGLLDGGYTSELMKLFREFQVDIGTDMNEIKVGSAVYNKMTIESKRRYVLLKLLEELHKQYSFNFISKNDGSTSQADKNENKKNQDVYYNESDLEQESLEEFKQKYIIDFLLGELQEIYNLYKKFDHFDQDIRKVIAPGSLLFEFIHIFLKHQDFDEDSFDRLYSMLSDRKAKIFIDSIILLGGVDKAFVDPVCLGNGGKVEAGKKLTIVNSSDLIEIDPINETNLGFSFFSKDFGIYDAKEIGFKKLKQVYSKYLPEIISHFSKKLGTIEGVSQGLLTYQRNELEGSSEIEGLKVTGTTDKMITNDSPPIYQASYTFDLEEELTDDDIRNLCSLLQDVSSKWNNISMKENEYFPGYINPNGNESEDDIIYKGIFQQGKGFETNNLLYLSNSKSGRKTLSINLNNFTADLFTFLSIQIGFYLKHKKFLNKETLYANIYHSYNQKYIEGSTIYDIECFTAQYEDFIKKIVYPLSREYLEQNGRSIQASSTIFLGLHGTGKSQFIMNLLQNKVFNYGESELNLNATVIPIDLLQLKSLLEDDFSEIKQRLIEVSENSNIPVVIVIEDIDTLMSNDPNDPGIFDQMLTNLFEGVGAIPNITVIASSNYPEKISARMIRQNRFENIMMFSSLQTEEQVKSMFSVHIKSKHLEEFFTADLLNEYSGKFIGTTPSHIANFISEISRERLFRIQMGNKAPISSEDINKIFENLNMNFPLLEQRESEINIWLKDIRSKEKGSKVGFLTENNIQK